MDVFFYYLILVFKSQQDEKFIFRIFDYGKQNEERDG